MHKIWNHPSMGSPVIPVSLDGEGGSELFREAVSYYPGVDTIYRRACRYRRIRPGVPVSVSGEMIRRQGIANLHPGSDVDLGPNIVLFPTRIKAWGDPSYEFIRMGFTTMRGDWWYTNGDQILIPSFGLGDDREKQLFDFILGGHPGFTWVGGRS